MLEGGLNTRLPIKSGPRQTKEILHPTTYTIMFNRGLEQIENRLP